VEIYCVIITAFWSRDGSAVVSVHPPAARVKCREVTKCAVLVIVIGWEVWRTGQAGVFRKKLN